MATFSDAWKSQYSNLTREELEDLVVKLQRQVNVYKPLFLSLVCLVIFAILFCICLVIPSRRRQKFQELLKVKGNSVHGLDNVWQVKGNADSQQGVGNPGFTDPSGSSPKNPASGGQNKETQINAKEKQKTSGNPAVPRRLPDYGEITSYPVQNQKGFTFSQNSIEDYKDNDSQVSKSSLRKKLEALQRGESIWDELPSSGKIEDYGQVPVRKGELRKAPLPSITLTEPSEGSNSD